MADRFLYLPLIGFAVLAGYLLGNLLKNPSKHRLIAWTGPVILLLIIVLLTITSYQATKVWKDDISLWTDTVRKNLHGLPYLNLGVAYQNRGQMEKAKQAFIQAVRMSPDEYKPYRNLGMLYMKEKNIPKAQVYFEEALRLNPRDPYTYMGLSNIYEIHGELDNAERIVNHGLERLPGDEELLSVKANLLFRKGEPDPALKILEKLTEQGSEKRMVWYTYGVILSGSGRFKEAEVALNRALKIDADQPNVYAAFGSLYDTEGKYDIAVKYYENSLSTDPENMTVLNNLAYIYSERFPERIDRAIELAQKAVSLSPDNPDIIDTLGWAYFRKNRFDQAIRFLDQSLALRPDSPVVLYHLGVSHLSGGDPKRGKEYLRMLVMKHPKHELTARAKELLE